jgi:hypothetical protein
VAHPSLGTQLVLAHADTQVIGDGLVQREAGVGDEQRVARVAEHLGRPSVARASQLRVRVELMGPGKYEHVGESQSVLMMINPMISPTPVQTRSLNVATRPGRCVRGPRARPERCPLPSPGAAELTHLDSHLQRV